MGQMEKIHFHQGVHANGRRAILRLGDFLSESALANGQLIPLLADYHDDDQQQITALLLPDRQSIPRIRALVDFLKARL